MGPWDTQCLACSSDYYIQSGSCIPRSGTAPPSALELFVFNQAAPWIPNNMRDGSAGNPFLDLRDALIKAQEVAAPYMTASATIFLTEGTHFVPLEANSARSSAFAFGVPILAITIK